MQRETTGNAACQISLPPLQLVPVVLVGPTSTHLRYPAPASSEGGRSSPVPLGLLRGPDDVRTSRNDILQSPSASVTAVELNKYAIRVVYVKAVDLPLSIGPDLRRSRQLNPLGSQLCH